MSHPPLSRNGSAVGDDRPTVRRHNLVYHRLRMFQPLGIAKKISIVDIMGRKIEDMVVIITGASSGIGKALAIALSKKRTKLVLASRSADVLEKLNFTLGGRHLCLRCDVSNPVDCQKMIDASVKRFGRIDTLVCNAGYGVSKTVLDTTAKEMADMFATNFFGTVDCIRAMVPYMQKQEILDGHRGQLMIVSSAAARRGIPYLGGYSATKAAQLSIAEALRVELAPSKIAVTSAHPVSTKTEFGKVAQQNGGAKMPPGGDAMQQTAEQVAIRICRAISNPVNELWPMEPARFMLSLGTFFPSMVDAKMKTFHEKVERWNKKN